MSLTRLYFTEDEILMGRDKLYPLSEDMKSNLLNLIISLSKVRRAYGSPLRVSSGYRPSKINASVGGSKKSAHQDCQAVDIQDKDGLFANWCLNNIDILKESGILGLEDPRFTMILNKQGKRVGGWVHLQIRPTKSGTFVFIPYAGGMEIKLG